VIRHRQVMPDIFVWFEVCSSKPPLYANKSIKPSFLVAAQTAVSQHPEREKNKSMPIWLSQ